MTQRVRTSRCQEELSVWASQASTPTPATWWACMECIGTPFWSRCTSRPPQVHRGPLEPFSLPSSPPALPPALQVELHLTCSVSLHAARARGRKLMFLLRPHFLLRLVSALQPLSASQLREGAVMMLASLSQNKRPLRRARRDLRLLLKCMRPPPSPADPPFPHQHHGEV